jgi:hypothetical protein
MKKNLLLLASILFLFSCGNKGAESKKENSEPEKKVQDEPSTGVGAEYKEFPDVVYELKEGDFVLAARMRNVKELFKKSDGTAKSKPEGVLIYSREQVISSKPKSSVVSTLDKEELDHRFVIPLPKGQKAKKGDILLTWTQINPDSKVKAYSPTLTRAIVTDDSNPAQPKVAFLSEYKFPKKEVREVVTLAENSFIVLKDDFVVGNMVYADAGFGKGVFQIMAVAGDKLLLLDLASHVFVKNKSECKLTLFKPTDLKAGDKVQFHDTKLVDATVKEIDAEKGQIGLTYKEYPNRPDKTVHVSFGLVTKDVELNKQ